MTTGLFTPVRQAVFQKLAQPRMPLDDGPPLGRHVERPLHPKRRGRLILAEKLEAEVANIRRDRLGVIEPNRRHPESACLAKKTCQPLARHRAVADAYCWLQKDGLPVLTNCLTHSFHVSPPLPHRLAYDWLAFEFGCEQFVDGQCHRLCFAPWSAAGVIPETKTWQPVKQPAPADIRRNLAARVETRPRASVESIPTDAP